MSFAVYILRSRRDGSYYVGQSEDVVQRVVRHNSGRVNATKSNGPWELVYTEKFETRREAICREREIKQKKSRKYMEDLIRSGTQSGPETESVSGSSIRL